MTLRFVSHGLNLMQTRLLSGMKTLRVLSTLCIGAATLPAFAGTQGIDTDFTNPAVEMTGQALVASGRCIAKYAVKLDDGSKPAPEIGQRIAKQCARQISRSAGLASWMLGKPEEYGKNLKYTN